MCFKNYCLFTKVKYINTSQTLSLYVHDSADLNIEILKEIDWQIYFLILVDIARAILDIGE